VLRSCSAEPANPAKVKGGQVGLVDARAERALGGRLSWPGRAGGRRVFKAGGFLNKKAADAWWKDEDAKLRGGSWLDPRAGEIPLREYFQRFYACKEQQGREAETLRDYRKTAERYLFPTFGDTPLNEVSKLPSGPGGTG